MKSHKLLIASMACLVMTALHAAELNQPEDIANLANSSVSSAIGSGGDDVGGAITGSTCSVFKAGISGGFKQSTSAFQTVQGAIAGAMASGISGGQAGAAVTQGIDTCLDTKLDYDTAAAVQAAISGAGINFNYVAPYTAYSNPHAVSPATDSSDTSDDTYCVSNCI